MFHNHHDENEKLGLIHETLQGRISQRAFTRRAVLMGIGATTIGAVLAACNSGGGSAAQGAAGKYTYSFGANKGKEYTATANYKPGSGNLKVQLGAKKDGPIYPEGYIGPSYREIEKFGDPKTEFTIVAVTPLGLDWKTNGFTKFLEETTGVKINFKPITFSGDPTEVQTKFNALLAAGDLPDAFMMGAEWMGGMSASQVYAYGAAGVLIPIDQYIDEYGPYSQEAFQQIPGMRAKITAPDGKLYGLPIINDCFHCKAAQQRTWVNTEWLKKVGLDKPTTTAEFETLLQAFKDKNPSGLPKATPATGMSKDGLIDYLMTGFTYCNSAWGWLKLNNKKVEFVASQPEFRKGLTWVASLFAKGLIDKNMFTQDNKTLQALGDGKGGPLFGVANGNTRGTFATKASFGTTDTLGFEPLLPLKGPDGAHVATWSDGIPGGATNLVITNKCKDPAALVRWGDAMLDLYMTLQQTRGKNSERWNWSKAGEVGINGKQAIYTMLPKPASTSTDPAAAYVWSWDEFSVYNKCNDVRLGEAVPDATAVGGEPELYRIAKDYEKYRQREGIFFDTPSFDATDATNVAQLKTTIESYVWQQIAAFCNGSADPSNDADWKKFTDGLASQQLPQYLTILQKAYDNSAAAKASK